MDGKSRARARLASTALLAGALAPGCAGDDGDSAGGDGTTEDGGSDGPGTTSGGDVTASGPTTHTGDATQTGDATGESGSTATDGSTGGSGDASTTGDSGDTGSGSTTDSGSASTTDGSSTTSGGPTTDTGADTTSSTGATGSTDTSTGSTSTTGTASATTTGSTSDSGTTGGGSDPLLWSTLDDAGSITSPARGSGDGAGFSVLQPSFVNSPNGSALVIDETNEWARFQQTSNNGAIPNVDLDRGTLTMWIQPTWVDWDNEEHRLVAIGSAAGGGILVRKGPQGMGGANRLQTFVYDSGGNLVGQTSVPSDDYSLFAGTWVHLRVTWDFTVGSGQQNVRVYLDDTEVLYDMTSTGPVTMPAASSGAYIWIGAWSDSDNDIGKSSFDEIEIWADPIVP